MAIQRIQPQGLVRLNNSSSILTGLTGAFTPAVNIATPVAGAILQTTKDGRGYAAPTASDSWIASQTALVSLSPTWTILTILSGVSTSNTGGGVAFYAERPNGTQIVKLGLNAGGSNAAQLVVRDAANNLLILNGSANIRADAGIRRVIIGTRRAANDHRIYVNGALDASSTTNISGAFSTTNAVIGNDPNDTTAFLAGASLPLVLVWNRSLSDDEILSVSNNPYQVFKTTNQISYAVAATGPTASFAWLEQNDTTAIAVTVTNRATLGWTEASDTTAIAAAVITTATLGWTEASDTSAIAVTVNTGGAVINWTEEPDTYAIVVSVPTRATLGWIEANDVTAITATASIPATATINWTEQNDTCAIIAAAVVNGGLAWTEQNDVTSITAIYAQLVTATLAWTEQSDIAGTSTFNEYFFTIMRQSIVNNSGSISNAPINRIGTFV